MANEYFQPGSVPAPNAPGSSAVMRQEFASVAAGFDKLPVLAGNAGEMVVVDGTGTKLTTSGAVVADYVTKDGTFTLTNKTIAWANNTFTGFGDAATRNAGKNAGQVLLLENNMQLPVIDGSLLTGLNAGMISGVVDIAHGGTGGATLGAAQTNLGIDLKADANNAVLTGAPTAPTPPTGDSSARLATTYFVTNTIADIGSFSPSNATPLMDGVGAPGTGALGSRDDHRHPTDTSRAPLASPALTGTPTAPTAAAQTNTDQIATTAFVNAEIAADRPYSDTDPLVNGVAAQGVSSRVSRQDHVHPTDTTRAPLASPTFTGVPAAPTPATQTNTTQIATTAFVQSLLAQQPPAGMQPSNSTPLMNGTAAPGTGVEGSRWDHVHPVDTSRVAKAGDTMSGNLTAPAFLMSAAQNTDVSAATRKDYVDTQLALKANLTGAAFTGTVSSTTGLQAVDGSVSSTVASRSLEVGLNTTLDSFIDLHGGGYADYSARLLRSAGANGSLLLQQRGGGDFQVSFPDSGRAVIVEAILGVVNAWGYKSRQGTQSATVSNPWNYYWNSAAMEMWVDSTLIGTVNYTPPSDERLKQNIVTTTRDRLSEIAGLRFIDFEYKLFPQQRHISGVLAQDLQAADPAFVTKNEDGLLFPNATELLYAALRAIQQLEEKVRALEAKCAGL